MRCCVCAVRGAEIVRVCVRVSVWERGCARAQVRIYEPYVWGGADGLWKWLLACVHLFVYAHRPLYPSSVCVFAFPTSYPLKLHHETGEWGGERIWPFNDFLGVLPDHVVLTEDEEGPVDGEAVLPDRDGVVQGHGACTLRFGLLEGWGDATCGHGRPIAVSVALGPSIPRAQQARDVVSKARHSVKKKSRAHGIGRQRETGDREGAESLLEIRARCCARCDSSGVARCWPLSVRHQSHSRKTLRSSVLQL